MKETMIQAISENILMLIFSVGYAVFVFYQMYKEKKTGGRLIKVYRHNSSNKTFGKVMVLVGCFYVFMYFLQKDKTPTVTFTFALFIFFITMMAYITLRELYVYEEGIMYSGRFTYFKDMKDIKKVAKNGVQINLEKKKLANIIYIKRIEEEKDFITKVRRKIKQAKRKEQIKAKEEKDD